MTTIPSTKQDILQHLLKQGQASAQDLANDLGISPQAIRRHLKDLEDEGLIQYHNVQVGMGRPQHLYQLSESGRQQFPSRHDEFAVDLLDTLAETLTQEQMKTILRKQWQRKAMEYRDRLGKGPLAERLEGLVKLRQAEGYMAEYHPVEDTNSSAVGVPSRFILTEYNCAISNVAKSFPGVCDHELEMFSLALGECQVERTHWVINGEHRCGYLIQEK